MASNQTHVNDTLIAPQPFTADASSPTAAEDWLAHFQRYANFKKLTTQQQIDLFSLLLRGAPAQWYSTLSNAVTRDWHQLVAEFKSAYFPNANLLWCDSQKLLSMQQQPNESVTAFVARVKHQSRRLHITAQTLHHAVLSGLRPSLRQFVVTQGGLIDLPTAIEVALRAESNQASDPMTSLLMDSVEAQSKVTESQNQRIEELTQKLRTLETKQGVRETAAAVDHGRPRNDYSDREDDADRGRSSRRYSDRKSSRRYPPSDEDDYSHSRERSRDSQPKERREYKQTPQRIQKQNYVRQQSGERPTAFDPRRSLTPTPRNPCGNCGYHHERGACRAKNLSCRSCSKIGHIAKMCRSAKRQ